jgi:hypothetical protein
MVDERLREGTRGPGAADPAARAGHLRDRVRAGSLSESQIALGATLGDPACGLLSPNAPAGPGPSAWNRSLQGHGQELLLRAGLAAAWLALLVMEVDHPEERQLHRVLELAGRWILDPEDSLAEDAYQGALEANRPLPQVPAATAEIGSLKADLVADSLALDEAMIDMLRLDAAQTQATGRIWEEIRWRDRAGHAARAVEGVAVGVRFPYDSATLPDLIGDVLRHAAEATSVDAVLGAIRRAVVPWILGEGDPVRERLGEPS